MHNVTVSMTGNPLKDSEESWYKQDIPIFYPHEVLSYLFETVNVRVPEKALRNYWQEAKEHKVPWACHDDDPNDLRIPIKFFCDDASMNDQGDKVFAFVLSCPLFRPKQARHSRWPVAVIGLKHSVGWATLRPVLSELVYSLNLAFDTKTQSGFRFQVTEMGMDWKALREVFQLRTHWNSTTMMCHMCKTGKMDYPSLPDDLEWRTTAEFLADILPTTNVSPLVLLRRFDISILTWCSLHVLNLGLLWTLNGGAFAHLIELGIYGDSSDVAQCLKQAFSDFKSWQASSKVRCSQRPFTMNMLFKKSHGAYLSTKGHNARCICAYLADKSKTVLGDCANPSDELVLQTHAMCWTCSLHYFLFRL